MSISSALLKAACCLAVFSCSLATAPSRAAEPVNLNLSSTTASVPQAAGMRQIVINVGGHSVLVKPGDMLTPAQSAAVRQVMSTGAQSLVIGSSGNATAGSIALGAFQNIGTLYVPTGVTASALTVIASGIIQNQGTIASSRDLSLTGATIMNLGGTIRGVGDVTLFSQDGNFLNTGNISSSAGSINFRTGNPAGLTLDSTTGSVSASKAVSLYGGSGGDIRATFGAIQGTLNAYGCTAHVSANSDLSLGSIVLTGDPVFYSAGDLHITQNQIIPNGEDLALLASRNIIADAGVNLLQTSGGDITIAAGTSFLANNPTPGSFTFAAFDPSGGSVKLSGVTIKTGTSATGSTAGTLAIFASGGSLNNGSINVGPIDTSAKSGNAGIVRMIGPGQITTGGINAAGKISGFITIEGTTVTAPGLPPSFSSTGTSTSDSFSSGTLGANSSLTVNGAITTTSATGFGGSVFADVQKDVVVNGPIVTSTTAVGNFSSGNILFSSNSGNLLFRNSVILNSKTGHGGMATLTVVSGTGGLELNKGIDTSGKTGGGDIVVNVFGDINVGFNPVINAPAGSSPLLMTHQGGINTSSSTMAAGAIDLATQLGSIAVANDVNAAGFEEGGHLFTMSPGFLRIDGKINTSSKTSDGAFVSINSGSAGTYYDLFGTDVGAINASGFTSGGAGSRRRQRTCHRTRWHRYARRQRHGQERCCERIVRSNSARSHNNNWNDRGRQRKHHRRNLRRGSNVVGKCNNRRSNQYKRNASIRRDCECFFER
jgi:adhesin HecA-like repeat protein